MEDFRREDVIEKLDAYLQGEISRDEMYQWALAAAVSDGYAEAAKEDFLLGRAIQDMIDCGHPDKSEAHARRVLGYHLRCLTGQKDFNLAVVKTSFVDSLVIFRIYVVLFAVCSLGIQVLTLLRPELLLSHESGGMDVARIGALLPHILYAVTLLLPVRVTAKGFLFYPTFLIMLCGAYFYWYMSLQLVMRMLLHIMFVLVILPFGGIPAAVALVLLVMRKIEYWRIESEIREREQEQLDAARTAAAKVKEDRPERGGDDG